MYLKATIKLMTFESSTFYTGTSGNMQSNVAIVYSQNWLDVRPAGGVSERPETSYQQICSFHDAISNCWVYHGSSLLASKGLALVPSVSLFCSLHCSC